MHEHIDQSANQTRSTSHVGNQLDGNPSTLWNVAMMHTTIILGTTYKLYTEGKT